MSINSLLLVGLGQLGASIAMAAKEHTKIKEIAGVDEDAKALDYAISKGIISKAYGSIEHISKNYDLSIIAIPVSKIAPAAIKLHRQQNTIISDIGSVKYPLIKNLTSIDKFVPAHPLAGREKAGPEYADANMFIGKSLIITPYSTHNQKEQNLVASFWHEIGSDVSEMDAEFHDKLYSIVSHLVQLLAYAYANLIFKTGSDIPNSQDFKRFFRLYSSSFYMWSDVFCANIDNIKTAAEFFVSILPKQKFKIVSEFPIVIAKTMKQTALYFTAEYGVNVEAYAAGAYPDFTSPLTGWNANIENDVEVEVADFISIVSEILSHSEACNYDELKRIIEDTKRYINGIS